MKPNRGWLVYFLLLFVGATAATSVIIWYNLRQQLRPEQLVAARKIWDEKGPKTYVLTYTVKLNELDTSDQYFVRVEDGKVVEVTVDGRAQTADRFHNYGMERLFDYLEEFMDRDTKKDAPKVFVRAIFHPDNAALRLYVRRVMGTRDRVEITVDPLLVRKP